MASISRMLGTFVLCIGVALSSGPIAAADDPLQLVENLARRAIPVLTDQSRPATMREEQFRVLLREGFDTDHLARLVLERYWNQMTVDQRAELVVLLEIYLARIYSSQFIGYRDVTVIVVGTRAQSGATTVQTRLRRPDAAPVQIDWRVEPVAGTLRITDLVVEGVSMVITFRSEFASVIRQYGGEVEGLLVLLRQKSRA
jgi:phospholipid transport system substrate-binding protein